MTRKERVRVAMSGAMPDRVPVVLQICPPHAIRVAGMPYRETLLDRLRNPEKYDLLIADCGANYGVDGLRAFLGVEPQQVECQGEKAYTVDPHTGERTGAVDFEGGGAAVLLPERKRRLTEADIDAIQITGADELMHSTALRPLRKTVEKYGAQYFVAAAPGAFTVQGMYAFQGMEATLMDMVDRPDFVRQWSDRQLGAAIQRAIAMARAGADALYIGDTFAQFMSPKRFEELCLPFFQRFVEALRPHGPLIYLHMCGRTTHLLDLVPETGVDCFEPLDEVAGTCVAEAKRRIGQRVALMGGVNTVHLARGSVEQVRQDCIRCVREGGEGGGYILAACDMLPTETNPEKVRTMLEVASAEGRYA